MKKTVFAAAVAFGFAVNAAPGFTAERNADWLSESSSTFDSRCDSVLASKDGHTTAHIRYCENRN